MDSDSHANALQELLDAIYEIGNIIYEECEGGAPWLTGHNLYAWYQQHKHLGDHIVKIVELADRLNGECDA